MHSPASPRAHNPRLPGFASAARTRANSVATTSGASVAIRQSSATRSKEGMSELRHAFVTPRVWLLGAAYFCIVCGIYIVSFWLPTIIKQTGVANPLTIGLLTSVPYIVAVIAMIAVCAHADRTKERRWHTALPAVACAVGLVLTGAATGNTLVALIGLTLAAAGSSTAQASFWTLPSAFLGGAAAAAGIALVNSLGNVAGFVSTYVVGWLADLTHSNSASLYLFGGIRAGWRGSDPDAPSLGGQQIAISWIRGAPCAFEPGVHGRQRAPQVQLRRTRRSSALAASSVCCFWRLARTRTAACSTCSRASRSARSASPPMMQRRMSECCCQMICGMSAFSRSTAAMTRSIFE